jgi:hypothetical protein
MTRPIRLAISTCPNDTFAFHALVTRAVDWRGLSFEIELLDTKKLELPALARCIRKIRPRKIPIFEPGVGEHGAAKVGLCRGHPPQIGLREIGEFEVATADAHAREIGTGEIAMGEIGGGEVAAPQVEGGEV